MIGDQIHVVNSRCPGLVKALDPDYELGYTLSYHRASTYSPKLKGYIGCYKCGKAWPDKYAEVDMSKHCGCCFHDEDIPAFAWVGNTGCEGRDITKEKFQGTPS